MVRVFKYWMFIRPLISTFTYHLKNSHCMKRSFILSLLILLSVTLFSQQYIVGIGVSDLVIQHGSYHSFYDSMSGGQTFSSVQLLPMLGFKKKMKSKSTAYVGIEVGYFGQTSFSSNTYPQTTNVNSHVDMRQTQRVYALQLSSHHYLPFHKFLIGLGLNFPLQYQASKSTWDVYETEVRGGDEVVTRLNHNTWQAPNMITAGINIAQTISKKIGSHFFIEGGIQESFLVWYRYGEESNHTDNYQSGNWVSSNTVTYRWNGSIFARTNISPILRINYFLGK